MRVRAIRFAAALILWGASARGQLREGHVVRGFRLPDYAADGTLKSVVTGDSARAVGEDVFEITNLRIEMMKDGAVEARVTAPLCLYNRRANEATSDGSVRIVRGEVVITGEGFTWNGAKSRFEIERNARVVLRNVRLIEERQREREEKKP